MGRRKDLQDFFKTNGFSLFSNKNRLLNSMHNLCEANCIPDNVEYKEVVVVGNGPSGLTLSFLLSGNWPYYNGQVHPDEMLSTRLKSTSTELSLIQQDLHFLAQGLEGRSNNPVSILVDTLIHPLADTGLDLPSLLKWRHHPEKVIEHVVLGKGPPGGSWQKMDGDVFTISLGSWMELPDLNFRDGATSESPNSSRTGRAAIRSVAKYYKKYVKHHGLSRFFKCGTIVTSVRSLDNVNNFCMIDPETGISSCDFSALWVVEGYEQSTGNPFCYITPRVVVATGSNDLPNYLNIAGELSYPSWVVHNLRDLEEILNTPTDSSDPVLIVGGGLSAADAVLATRFHSIPVLHVFRSKQSNLDKMLPESMYPEYHKVHQMMSDRSCSYPNYSAMPEHQVLEIQPNHQVLLQSSEGKTTLHRIRAAAILIGSRPDLSFLEVPQPLQIKPNEPLDCRSNPIAIDPYNYRCVRAPPGLYVLGPLAGDNFVRFLQGGAVAILGDIHKDMKSQTII